MTTPNPKPSRLDSMRFVENPEPRCPCLLLIDTSRSMSWDNRINEVDEGLQALKQYLSADPLASLRAEIAVMTFSDGHKLVQDFGTASELRIPKLKTRGGTNAFPAIREAMSLIQQRTDGYRQHSIKHYRPLLFLLTDGEIVPRRDASHPMVIQMRDRLQQASQTRELAFFAIAISDSAHLENLQLISPTPPKRLREHGFDEFFKWLSASLSAVSQSQVDSADRIYLPSTEGWSI